MRRSFWNFHHHNHWFPFLSSSPHPSWPSSSLSWTAAAAYPHEPAVQEWMFLQAASCSCCWFIIIIPIMLEKVNPSSLDFFNWVGGATCFIDSSWLVNFGDIRGIAPAVVQQLNATFPMSVSDFPVDCLVFDIFAAVVAAEWNERDDGGRFLLP